MVSRLINISGKKFVTKILEGIKDFTYIKLEEDFDLSKDSKYEELKNYLANELEEINISNSEFIGLKIQNNEDTFPFYINLVAENSNLGMANLENITFTGGSFYRANLNKINLKKINFYSNINLSEVILKYATVSDSHIENVYLFKTDLRDTKFNHNCCENANFSNVNFESADISNSNFKKTKMSHAKLKNTIIRQANMSFVDALDADFENADLTETQLSVAYLMYANFKGTNLEKTEFGRANLVGAKFGGVKNLETALGLEYAIIQGLQNCTKQEKEIIQKLRSKAQLFK